MSKFVVISHRSTWDGFDIYSITYPNAVSVVKAVQRNLKGRESGHIVGIVELDDQPTLDQVREVFSQAVDHRSFVPRLIAEGTAYTAGRTIQRVAYSSDNDQDWVVFSFHDKNYRWDAAEENGYARWDAGDIVEAKEVTVPQPDAKTWIAA